MAIPPQARSLPRVCVALQGDGTAERAEALVEEFQFFEFRLDTATDPFEAVFEMGAVLRRLAGLRCIATCRRTANGGSFAGTAADEIEMLRQAVAVGAHIVDLSLETAEEMAINPHALVPLRRGKSALLLSWHDFRGTPPLAPVLERMRRIGADLYKVVPTATSLHDSFALLDLLERYGSERNLVGMSMGMPGVLTRILGPRYGSLFTFAAAASGAETAPGQVDARTLRDLYRVDAITAATEVYGVFGKPISGSRSPVMLNTAFREIGVDAVYLPFETDDADELFATLERLRLEGASVTMPLKETILPRLQRIEPMAEEVGAANTLRRMPDGAIAGSNTDVLGITEPLRARMSLSGRTALVLGAGGVARAAAYALKQQGCRVTISNRTFARAAELAAQLGCEAIEAEAVTARGKPMHFDLLLNATPFGMPTARMAAPVDFAAVRCQIFFDLVYNPVETPLILAAREHGIETLPGVAMFLSQGAAQFETWTGRPAPQHAMREAVLAALAPA